ncbi:MAG: twin-arginine translocation signal domain-containing protein [Candidatus Poseidoniia archaeon]|jgi:hypothetical protein|nr:hypothetical protein [Euryarchaeota archaeon]MDP6274726.1 twin-arginine translocation signal domain-containing protein [Candidatus Poseidoniia archaeon]MEE1544285.1 twin-arginine translocation signal domain-containing protein [Alphaproteobacteria bacterium]MDP7136090.1 twin-arginine translocation signal domain-containing protein [Candidatus Poseidoniia archaeon]MDP7242908.1 twin-arginine translocation signal domain-containing protein [Candidatus Poseidoniia archaeon]|tara:strand:- start:1081 stop:1761 length:681 start_codon:yes stop_codon:yes gene_type:complete
MPVTRRNFLKGALALAGSGMGGALSVPALMTLLPPPVVRCNSDEAYDTLLFKEREPGTWYEPLAGKVARKEDFALNQAAMVTWAPKELEEGLGTCEIVLTLIKLPAEEAMIEWGISDDGGNAVMMAYHTYKCPHLCCKPVFMEKEELSSLSGDTYVNMFLCPCHLSLFDPLSIVEATDELGRKVMVAELVEGPAPYGLPIVPIIERDGELVGRTDKLEWLKYCGQG